MMKAVWNYLKSVKLRDILILIVLLYIIFWYLEGQKATGLLGHLAAQGNEWIMWLLALEPPSASLARQQVSTTPIQTFLAQPNEALLQLRDGFYDKPAGYYIRVDQQGHCQPKYSKRYQGYWVTPAEVLCPQVQALLRGQSLEPLTIPIGSGCERDRSDAYRRGWNCE